MTKSRFSDHECPVAQALDEIGDWWTLLIIREAMYGSQQFETFKKELGISRAVLTDRLKRLVATGIFVKAENEADGRATYYQLTEKGEALWPVMIALLNWSNQHIAPPKGKIVSAHSRKTGRNINHLYAIDSEGQVIAPHDVMLKGGSAASPRLRERLKNVFGKQSRSE